MFGVVTGCRGDVLRSQRQHYDSAGIRVWAYTTGRMLLAVRCWEHGFPNVRVSENGSRQDESVDNGRLSRGSLVLGGVVGTCLIAFSSPWFVRSYQPRG